MLQIIFFAVALGGAAVLIGAKASPLIQVCESLAQAMYALTGAIMKLAPFAVFALITPVAAAYGPDVLLPLAGVAAQSMEPAPSTCSWSILPLWGGWAG